MIKNVDRSHWVNIPNPSDAASSTSNPDFPYRKSSVSPAPQAESRYHMATFNLMPIPSSHCRVKGSELGTQPLQPGVDTR